MVNVQAIVDTVILVLIAVGHVFQFYKTRNRLHGAFLLASLLLIIGSVLYIPPVGSYGIGAFILYIFWILASSVIGISITLALRTFIRSMSETVSYGKLHGSMSSSTILMLLVVFGNLAAMVLIIVIVVAFGDLLWLLLPGLVIGFAGMTAVALATWFLKDTKSFDGSIGTINKRKVCFLYRKRITDDLYIAKYSVVDSSLCILDSSFSGLHAI